MTQPMLDMELDPERKLWIPGRRRFLFLGLGAAAAALLPVPKFRSLRFYANGVLLNIRTSELLLVTSINRNAITVVRGIGGSVVGDARSVLQPEELAADYIELGNAFQ
jgi:hypothetical protein